MRAIDGDTPDFLRESQPGATRPVSRREEQRIAQRLRLEFALIDAIANKGYRATRVADVIGGAGLSRKTFYKHFANIDECVLATFDLVADESVRRVEHAAREGDTWPERVEAAIRALFEVAVRSPGSLRLSLGEITAVGPTGIARRESAVARYEEVTRGALVSAPGRTIAAAPLKAIVGGLSWVLYARILHREHLQLRELVPDLVTWVTSYYPTPDTMLSLPSRDLDGTGRSRALRGGRAPGTLAPHTRLNRRRGLPRGDQKVPRSFVEQNQRERILDAVAILTASEGYAALNVEGIAEHAAVSLNAFYENFPSKEDAFLVAYEVGHGKALAAVERAYAAESDWRLGVRAGLKALFNFLASEPAFARMALVDAMSATSRTAECSSLGVSAFGRMLVPGADVTIEAISGGIFELCLHHALKDRVHDLPELARVATYIALAPRLGGEEAARIATHQPRGATKLTEYA
jgi:AcrR family transcriptional regulator